MRLLVSLPLLAAWASIGVPGASSFVPLRLRLSHRASSPSAFVPRHSTSEAVNGGTAEAEASSEAASETSEPGFVPSSEPASFSVVTEESPLGPVHTLTLQLGPSADASHGSLVLESGRIGRQAAGAVVLTRGETVIYSTCCRDSKPKEGLDGGDFVPLSVDYQERFSSAGMTSGGFLKRDGRLAEHEILTCRLIDRPVRPLIAAGWAHDTQLLSWVLSYDGVRSNEPTAIVASAASCYVSDVPMAKPVGAVQVGMVDGNFVVNPTMEADEKKSLASDGGGDQRRGAHDRGVRRLFDGETDDPGGRYGTRGHQNYLRGSRSAQRGHRQIQRRHRRNPEARQTFHNRTPV
mmetsp:Transcript_6919/g.14940  ORF Transcript_6919/g.14940 Transcript_6919/m.14940 type:complete len:349 (-) Transcript_6919:1638-2684(-)